MRIEKDSLGNVFVPRNAYYGAQTQRAILNFPISGYLSHSEYIKAIVLIKKAAVKTNEKFGYISLDHSAAIQKSCDEILTGKLSDQFIVDPYQAGAGTSVNMNVNEVIANRANELLGKKKGTYTPTHPNDHINMSQSTNDVIPTAIRLAILFTVPKLLDCMTLCENELIKKAKKFDTILKTGRTHLMDAVPIRLGQEFGAYAVAIRKDQERIETARKKLLTIGIGGTAAGTGINSHPDYHKRMVAQLKIITQLPLQSSINLFEPLQNSADFLELSASLRIAAQTFIRIGNDLRLLSSGPKTGFSEISLPSVQPGSSIMPGKVNPSIIEMLTMVCFQVIGFDLAILLSSQAGQLELNVMFPLIAFDILEQIRLLTNAVSVFVSSCLTGIKADTVNIQKHLDRSRGFATFLTPILGYEKTAQIVAESFEKNIPLEELLRNSGNLGKKQIKEVFDPKKATSPNRR